MGPEAVNSPRNVGVTLQISEILRVPDDYATIQEAIDAAEDGDIVVVADGAYTGPGNKNLDFHGKAITVRSENGPYGCIINCEDDGRGFHFHEGETATSVVDGFTITNGRLEGTGGILIGDDSGPTIRNCIIQGCTATHGSGGGIYCSGRATIDNCTVTGCSAHSVGGGIAVTGEATIENCTITGNDAEGGGGVRCTAGQILDCTIEDNAAIRGGGVAIGEEACIQDCVIANNRAGQHGGGILVENSATVIRCAIVANFAGDGGGAYGYAFQHGIFAHCIVSGNTASGDGGGLALPNTPLLTLTNCQIDNNVAAEAGSPALAVTWLTARSCTTRPGR